MCGRASIERLCSRCLIIFPVVASLTVIWTMFIASNNITPSPIPLLKSLTQPRLADILAEVDLNETNVNTHKGYITLNEVNENVFKPFGYEIIEASLPVPTVHMLDEPSCGFIFSEWLRVSQKPQPSIPPKEIPESLSEEFLLNGYAGLTKWYFNDHSSTGDSPRNWNRTSEFMSFSKAELGALAYNKESESMYHAMSGYPLRSKSGLVIGSMQPWVEVMALKHGVRKVLTVEYNSLTIPNEFRGRLSAIKPVEFAEDWQTYAGTFDFAASFSSIEHSGLGRYGDIIDPIGDLREMLKIRCLLKKGGLLFLGIPFGTDAIQYNAHRIYGSIRLAMMFYGFDWLATYSGETELPIDLTTTLLHSKGPSQYTQYTVVLRKI